MGQENQSHSENSSIHCQLAGVCGGCPWIEIPVQKQRDEKLKSLHGLLPKTPIEVLSVGEKRFRDRVDFTIKFGEDGQMKAGLWALKSSGVDMSLSQRELVDIHECPMMSPELEAWFQEFRKDLPPIKMGSVRLRVSPEGERGVWLDFSNEDIKTLFDEKSYLKRLSEKAHVEVGQRKKPLHFENDQPKLSKTLDFKPWFKTWDASNKSYPVHSPVGGFSQSGLKANKVLVGEAMRAFKKAKELTGVGFWVEAFCGSGNFTYPLSRGAEKVLAFENDRLSLSSLEEGLKQAQINNVELMAIDAKSVKQIEGLVSKLPLDGNYALLADPPRSGLMRLLDFLKDGVLKPKALVYISCFSDSLTKDAEVLKSLGYELQILNLVDQFVHSPHVEWVSLWTLVSGNLN